MFRKTLAHELDTVFLNKNEFGEIIFLDEREVRAILEDITLEEDSERAGLALQCIKVHVKEEDVPAYFPGKEVYMNHTKYLCLQVSKDMGLLILTLCKELSSWPGASSL